MPRRSPDPLDSIRDLADDGAVAAKRGRPAKVEGQPRASILVRVSAEEKAWIIALAEERGQGIAELILTALEKLRSEKP
jgi:hypothetical protein